MVSRWLVVTALVACGPVKGNPPGDDAPPDSDPGTPDFQLAVVSSSPVVPLGGQAAIELAITRVAGFDGEITVSVVTPPSGLAVTTLTIPSDATTAELVVGASAPLVIGDTITFTLAGSATGFEDKQLMITDAEVTGRPGSPDITFGPVGTGFNSISLGSDDNGEFKAFDIVNGNVFAIGTTVAGLGANRMVLAKFTATGTVDSTFNGGSRLLRTYGGCSGDFSDGIAVGHQFDGRLIMIGYQNGCGLNAFAASRVSTTGGDGGVDFGTLSSPARTLIDTGQVDVANDGMVLSDGRILFVGSINGQLGLLLATSTGQLDTSAFGGAGFFAQTIGANSSGNAVALDSQNRIVVAGVTVNAGQNDIVVARFTLAGIDTTFGTNGVLEISTPNESESVTGVHVLADGAIVVGGGSSAARNYQVHRIAADGSGVDTTFGTAGVGEVTAPGNALKMAVLPDGKILLLGDIPPNVPNRDVVGGVLVRFKANGQPDPLFGTDSVQSFPFGSDHTATALSVYDQHTVMIGGGNSGGTPGTGTSGVVARAWM